MLAQYQKSVYLSFLSTDLPIWSGVEAIATLFQKDQERFHLLLTEPAISEQGRDRAAPAMTPLATHDCAIAPTITTPRLIWLEFSPYRVALTMQGNGQGSYRHLFERGMYGISRYWLSSTPSNQFEAGCHDQIRLKNYTRSLILQGKPLPDALRVEYELWSDTVPLGHYVLNLEIQH